MKKFLSRVYDGFKYMFDKNMVIMYDIEVNLDEKTIEHLKLDAINRIANDDKALLSYGVTEVLKQFIKENENDGTAS